MKWSWQKITALIAGFFGIGTLVSCYGMPRGDSVEIKGTVTGLIDGELKPIPDISVYTQFDKAVTDEKGEYVICGYLKRDSLLFEDEDLDNNGCFKPMYIPLENEQVDVTLEETTLEELLKNNEDNEDSEGQSESVSEE